ncbi:MAG: phosphatidylserine/phosphatidylglycerophosphate/cardiolipin synthase family protein [Candidatus Latescibacteria bacterium]|nr:phosphatidylserine/phosphatidylglycerophosphate/cardiolipin synthase family protein [Candidatus Latescibacterota bacterium]
MQYQLLVDEQFRVDLFEKLARAKKRVYMQFMTFEGDQAGLTLAAKLIELKNTGIDVRVVIDCFTDFVVSDTYYTRKSVRAEVAATKDMIRRMRDAGISVVRTRPYGPFNFFFVCRNHKKIIIVDDYSYIGGINISDHNYAWHDFMIRFDEPDITQILLKDFQATLKGELINLNEQGIVSNEVIKNKYLQVIRQAKREIVTSSPYFLCRHLIKIARQGKVKLILLTLKKNNYGVVNPITTFVFPLLKHLNVDVYFYKRFSHAKFIIVDREKVLLGSSNFCVNDFTYQQELGLYVEDRRFAENLSDKLFTAQHDMLEK